MQNTTETFSSPPLSTTAAETPVNIATTPSPPACAEGTAAPAGTLTTLPGKPSALIRVALADLRKVEALPDIYRVNMDVWHREHRADAVCEVCLAGSMISQSLGAQPGEHRGPEDFDQETTWKLYALNEFRVGNVYDGLTYLDRSDLWLGADTRTITEYTTSPSGFHRDMQKLAGDLEAVGL
ncbi:hypothetical protein DES53_11557 [Roseimicrobium gellanilyticum]|uniref:Uncharacterized protein n=1 Tax=Roseimicrobium gellanilyticum TaxID=748857 RepID=A0A366H6N0_9BACT|nr:hypothetical protein [Roseimicrobium gellanilyticum]RBP36916.1 hypothetical protein DES53_11557 [Roseimicrobium gellanilyticum]